MKTEKCYSLTIKIYDIPKPKEGGGFFRIDAAKKSDIIKDVFEASASLCAIIQTDKNMREDDGTKIAEERFLVVARGSAQSIAAIKKSKKETDDFSIVKIIFFPQAMPNLSIVYAFIGIFKTHYDGDVGEVTELKEVPDDVIRDTLKLWQNFRVSSKEKRNITHLAEIDDGEYSQIDENKDVLFTSPSYLMDKKNAVYNSVMTHIVKSSDNMLKTVYEAYVGIAGKLNGEENHKFKVHWAEVVLDNNMHTVGTIVAISEDDKSNEFHIEFISSDIAETASAKTIALTNILNYFFKNELTI